MEKYYKRLIVFLFKNNYIDDIELYEYSIKILLRGFFGAFIILFIGIMLGMESETVVFLGTFLLIRKFSGGFHFNKYINCFISSNLCLLIVLLFIKFIKKSNGVECIFDIILILSSISICLFAPMDNKNKKITRKQKFIFKIVSLMILSVYLLIITHCLTNENLIYKYVIGSSIILTGLLLCIGQVVRIIRRKEIC